MKKLIKTILVFIIGWGGGMLYKPTYKPIKSVVSHCNQISKYDFYDYEERVLKEGDKDKLHEILVECGVERFPYMIIMYDVYNGNVCSDLELYYSLIKNEPRNRNYAAIAPLHEFVKDVLTEYTEKGDEKGMRALKYFYKDEKGE